MKNISAERANINEYIKSKLKDFAETFATLGEILVGNSDSTRLTDDEFEAEQIWITNPEAKKAIEEYEAKERIPEKLPEEEKISKKGMKGGKSKGTGNQKDYEIKTQIQRKVQSNGIVNNQEENETPKQKDDDYVI